MIGRFIKWLGSADERYDEYRARMDAKKCDEVDHTWFQPFADELEAIVDRLPAEYVAKWKRDTGEVWLQISAPTGEHRPISVSATKWEIDYAFGRLWGEYIAPTHETAQAILAAIDAVLAGRVREVTDRWTGLRYHIYRLRTRGFDKFEQDSEYAFRHYLNRLGLPIRKVKVHRISPLVATPANT